MIKRLLTLSLAAGLVSACGHELDASQTDGQAESESDLTSGWTLLRVIESAHPYSNNIVEANNIQASTGKVALKLVFDSFETEAGYDFVDITGGALAERLSGNSAGRPRFIGGTTAQVAFSTDSSVVANGFRISVYERGPCLCPALYAPVCGVDGQTYGNSCNASCGAVDVASQGACAIAVSTAQLKADPASYNGTRVTVRGHAVAGPERPMAAACRPGQQCCGGFMRYFALDGIELKNQFSGSPSYTCSRNICALEPTCDPFSSPTPAAETFVGTFKVSGSILQLEVDSHTP